MKKYLALISVFAFASCSAIKPDYVVQEVSLKDKPTWVESGIESVKQDGKSLYFIGSAENLNKRICMKLAQVQADEQFALKINQQIIGKYKMITASNEVNTEDESISKAEQKIFDELNNNVLAQLNGSVQVQDYWEKRAHRVDLGSLKDYNAFSCYVLKKMDSKTLETMMKAHFSKKIKELKSDGTLSEKVENDLISSVSEAVKIDHEKVIDNF